LNWEAVGAIGELLSALAVLITLVYLAVQVRQSKALLERNEKISLSQVHQARTDTRVNIHIAQFNNAVYANRLYAIWNDPDFVAELTEAELSQARAMMMASIVIQDNALYQSNLGLLDEDTLNASMEVIKGNYEVWEKLGLAVTPRIERTYHQLKNNTEKSPDNQKKA